MDDTLPFFAHLTLRQRVSQRALDERYHFVYFVHHVVAKKLAYVVPEHRISIVYHLSFLQFVIRIVNVVVDLPQTYRHINFAFLCEHLVYIMIVCAAGRAYHQLRFITYHLQVFSYVRIYC